MQACRKDRSAGFQLQNQGCDIIVLRVPPREAASRIAQRLNDLAGMLMAMRLHHLERTGNAKHVPVCGARFRDAISHKQHDVARFERDRGS